MLGLALLETAGTSGSLTNQPCMPVVLLETAEVLVFSLHRLHLEMAIDSVLVRMCAAATCGTIVQACSGSTGGDDYAPLLELSPGRLCE